MWVVLPHSSCHINLFLCPPPPRLHGALECGSQWYITSSLIPAAYLANAILDPDLKKEL